MSSDSVAKGSKRSTIAVFPQDLALFKKYKTTAYGPKFGPTYPHEKAFRELVQAWFQAHEDGCFDVAKGAGKKR